MQMSVLYNNNERIILCQNIYEIKDKLKSAKMKCFKGKPICILLKTVMGNGVDFMMHTHEWHGKAPNDEQLEIGLSQNEETLGDY